MKDLQSLMNHIASTWVCDHARYPALEGMDVDQRRNFLVKHSLLHVAKTSGKIAAVCENFDHTNRKEDDSYDIGLQVGAVKLFVNAIKLAEETGLSADDLLRLAPGHVE
jgi:hypothetical protein